MNHIFPLSQCFEVAFGLAPVAESIVFTPRIELIAIAVLEHIKELKTHVDYARTFWKEQIENKIFQKMKSSNLLQLF